MPTSPKQKFGGTFRARMFKWASTGAWHFVEVPERLAPPVTHSWGRTPVHATVDGHAWNTSVWRTKEGKRVLAVPKVARGAKGDGDIVRVTIAFGSL